MKDYRVSIKISNNHIAARIEALGLTPFAFCKRYHLSYPRLCDLIALRISPLTKRGVFRGIVHQLCAVFNCLPEELFTMEQMTPLNKNTAEWEMSIEEVRQVIAGPDATLMAVLAQDQQDKVDAALRGLYPREEMVLRRRFGLDGPAMTLFELSEEMGVSRHRVREIEFKALRKLRQPDTAAALKALLEAS